MKDELIRTGGIINTLDRLIKEAIEIDNKLFKRSIEKRYNGGTSGIGHLTFFTKSRSYRPNHKERDLYRYIPIDLDFTERKPGPGLGRNKRFKGKKQ